MKRTLLALFIIAASLPLSAQDAKPVRFPADDEVRKILAERIDTQKQGVSMVVGLVDASGRRVIGYGTFGADKHPVDGDTLYEIGSATKAFTALLLADAVVRGEVSLDDPVAKFLPKGVTVPERGVKKITLVDLATHTSGLPRLPSNLLPKDAHNPYADYTPAQLHEFLSGYVLTRDIGSSFEYSNLGMGLVGHALALRETTDYETLVRKRITGPLSMKSTAITLTPALAARLAPGYDAQMQPAGNWDFTTALAGAGALRSTANDILTFLAANAGLSESPLSGAMTSMLKTRRPSGSPDMETALGWQVFKKDGRQIIWHNGGTGGYRSFMGFDPERRAGVVVLSNMSTERGVDDIGRHLLDPGVPLAPAPKVRAEITLDPKVLDRYVGRYELMPGFILTVTRDGNQLFLQATGQPKNPMFAEGEREFFLKIVDAQVTFEADGAAEATGLVLHQGGRDMPAKRLPGGVPEAKERKAIAVAPAVLDRYTGNYQLAPGIAIAITRDGDQLFIQLTGQSKLEMFAESKTEFFLKVVDAQVTFVAEGEGRASKLILHQNGRDMPAPRTGE